MDHYTLEDRLSTFLKISEKKLIGILCKISGPKDLIIHSSLFKPLNLIIGVQKLRKFGVEKFFHLETSNAPMSTSQRIFFIPSDLITVKRVCDQINSERGNGERSGFHLVLVCRRLTSIERLIEEEGLHGVVQVYPFQWELIPLDTRLFSLESPTLFRQLFVERDQSFLPCVARSIWTLQMILGAPHITLTIGKFSSLVAGMVKSLSENLGATNRKDPDAAALIIIDRDTDYATPLLTGATYTSLLDEVFGVKTGSIEIKLDEQKKSTQFLNSKEEVYSKIKNTHFSDVLTIIKQEQKDLEKVVNQSKTMGLEEMKVFVSKKLKEVDHFKKLLVHHILACEGIVKHIADRFESLQNCEHTMLEGRNRRENMAFIENSLAMDLLERSRILRLISLFSFTQDGLFSDEITNLKNQFLHKFGYKYLTLFHNLEKLGLFNELPKIISTDLKIANKLVQAVSLPTRKSVFFQLAQKFKLFPEMAENYSLKDPTDMGYVFGGAYIPLACQIVNYLIKNEMSIDEISKALPNTSKFGNANRALRSFVVYFVGGFTYSEVAGFQLLEKLHPGVKIIICGTSVINGNTLVNSCS